MDSGSRRELERLFYLLCELDPDERDKVLDRECPNPRLRRELEVQLALITPDVDRVPCPKVPRNFLGVVLPPDIGLRALPHTRTHPEHDGLAGTIPEGIAPRSILHPIRGERLTRIAKYTILRELGHGGMGVVYLAHDDKLSRNVAIKWLLSTERELVRRFMSEARATARCRHDNIVVIHEVEEHEGHPYIVFEYLRGQTLRQWMREQDLPLSLIHFVDTLEPTSSQYVDHWALGISELGDNTILH